MFKNMSEAFQRNLGEIVSAAPDAYYSVAALADVQKSFFYCGAGAVFQVMQYKAAVKVEAGIDPVKALTEAMDEVVLEITQTSIEHKAQLLASLRRLKDPEDVSNG